MSKLKKLVAVVLRLCACAGVFAFTACGGNGGTQTEGGGNQPAKEPVTTVANEEEWKKALDVFSLNSFSLYETSNYEDIPIPITANIDMVNYKANFTSEIQWANRYYEYSDNIFWEYNSSSHHVYRTETDAAGAKECLKAVLTTTDSDHIIISLPYLHTLKYVTDNSKTDYKTISELFAEFTYQENSYISKPLYIGGIDSPANIKIVIKDGVLSEFELSLSENQTFTYRVTLKIDKVNSTTVTTPEEARQAIDAEIAKG